jgi:sulfane dehydrogenase subunit SoxC
MSPSQPKPTAGGGLLDRRSFLASGLRFTAISALGAGALAQAQERTPASPIPQWMRMLGATDLPYGTPAEQEQSVVRRLFPNTPETAGFSVWHTPIEKLAGIITPSALHFAVHHNGIPRIAPERHELMIHGLVERPLRFDLERLMRYPLVSKIAFLECAGNTAPNALSPTSMDVDCQELFGQISCSEWVGVPVKYLLQEAGVREQGTWVIAEGADGGSHARSLPVAKLMDDAIVALYQNGERIRPSQGYPMRLFVPGWEGNVNVKWLHRLEVTDRPAYTKDESGLYSEVLKDGSIERFTFPMGVKSVITSPSGLQRLPEKPAYYEISGLAWSGHGRISRVEVSADGGETWADAYLHGPVLDRALTRFSLPWYWRGQSATLMSRATDESGQTQPDRRTWKKRYQAHSFNHYNAIQVWDVDRDGEVHNVYA